MNDARPILLAVMGALAAWGTYLAVGAYWNSQNRDMAPLAGLYVAGAMGLFLGGWALLLAWRRARIAAREKERSAHRPTEKPGDQPNGPS